jgi:hypothetical protein
MFILTTLLRRLARRRAATRASTLCAENLSLRDWADLPPYHPRPDRAPC